jgi:hypothetical protein
MFMFARQASAQTGAIYFLAGAITEREPEDTK